MWRKNIYLKLQQPERWQELKKCEWRGGGGEEARSKLELRGGGEESELAASVRVAEKGGDLENAIPAATQSSVYIKPALLRRSRLSLLPSCPCLSRVARMDQDRSTFLVIKACPSQQSALPSCPCLSRAARMDQDQSAFLVITYSQGWIDGWMNYSWWTRSTLFHWGFFIWSQRLLFTRMPILELSNYFFGYFPPRYIQL